MTAKIWAIAAIFAMSAIAANTAMAQTPVKIAIDTTASYDVSLKCYRFYDVSQQVADALAARVSGAAQKSQQDKSATDKALKTVWNRQIELTKGAKSNKAVDDDLAKASNSIVADANAGVGGDPAANGRLDAIHADCAKFEKTQP